MKINVGNSIFQKTVATIVCAGVLASAFAVSASATKNFSCFTSECWRKADIASHPRLVKNVALQSAQGEISHFRDFRGSVLVVNFMYTHCATICNNLGAVSSQLATRLASEIKQGKVKVISISFDPTRDDVANMQAYIKRLDHSQGLWQVARPSPASANTIIKRDFGIVVIKNDFGGFDHNAALHIVDKAGYLVSILEFVNLNEVEKNVRRLL